MRGLTVVSVLSLMLTGCGLELLGTTAVRSTTEAQQLDAMQRQIHNAAGATGKVNLQRAVDTYYAEKGEYPATLEALAPGYLPTIPRRGDGLPFGYDASTGRVLDGPVAPPPTRDQDAESMAAIRQAINAYGQATGYYPPNLQALVPQYLPYLPSTASGQTFVYNAQNGYLGLPQGTAARRSTDGPLAPGLSPMGETMTGTTVHRELNRMGNSGANTAGSYARGSVNNVSNQHNDRQNQVMNDLGL